MLCCIVNCYKDQAQDENVAKISNSWFLLAELEGQAGILTMIYLLLRDNLIENEEEYDVMFTKMCK